MLLCIEQSTEVKFKSSLPVACSLLLPYGTRVRIFAFLSTMIVKKVNATSIGIKYLLESFFLLSFLHIPCIKWPLNSSHGSYNDPLVIYRFSRRKALKQIVKFDLLTAVAVSGFDMITISSTTWHYAYTWMNLDRFLIQAMG